MIESKKNYDLKDLKEVKFAFKFAYWLILNTKNEINSEDPLYKLLLSIDEIKALLKNNNTQITKFFYFIREKIYKILYDSDEIIFIKYEDNNKNISFYFYLLLLIKDNPFLLNFTYDEKYIKEMINIQISIENSDDGIYKIIISKIIIDLLDDFQNSYDYYEEEDDKKIKKIKEDNLNIIKKNIDDLNYLDINWSEKDIEKNRIDDIYIEIIIALIKKKNRLDIDIDSDNNNIIKKLDLENTSLTEKMMDQLLKVLNNDDYINEYKIAKEEDFTKGYKINFYYNILKYLIKDDFYIYKIQLFLNTMNICKKMRKNKTLDFKIDKKNKLDKIKFIFLKFTGTDENIVAKKKPLTQLQSILSKISITNNTNKKNENSKIINTISSLKKESPENITELNCILYIRNLLSDNEIKNEFIKNIKENDHNNDKVIKYLKIEKKYEYKFKEIINNNKFISIFKKEEDLVFNHKFIKDFFYFEESSDDINKLKSNLPMQSNAKSIEIFKDWINKAKKDKSG